MTIQQVTAALGKPDEIIVMSPPRQLELEHTNLIVDFRSGPPAGRRDLVYTNLGLYILSLTSRTSTHVELVHAVAASAPFSRKTKEGIGIGSSRSDIIKAYGQPTDVKRPGMPNFELLSYSSPNIKFALQDDKVMKISTEFDLK